MSTSSSSTAMSLNIIWLALPKRQIRAISRHYGGMTTDRRLAIAALAGAGLLWGTTVPLSKLALAWLPPGWLTAVRFAHGRRDPAGRGPPEGCLAAAPGLQPGRAGLGRGRLRRVRHAAERRRRAHQRQPRGAADRRRPGAGRDDRGALAPQRGPPAGLGRVRALAGRGRLIAAATAAARARPATASCWRRCCCRPPSPWRRRGCCAGATRSRVTAVQFAGARSPACRSRC